MIKYIKELNSLEDFEAWEGGYDTLQDIIEANKIEKLNDLYFDLFYNTPTETEINDWLWYDRDDIYEYCGLNSNGDLIDDEEYTN